MRPADLLDGGLRVSPATDLALRDQLAHHRGNILDGHRRRYPVLVIQLDILGPKTRQRRLQPGPNLPTDLRPRGRVPDPELRRDHHSVADRRQRPADKSLVLAGGIALGRVEEGAPQVERLPHQVDGIVIADARPVTVAEPDRAQPTAETSRLPIFLVLMLVPLPPDLLSARPR